MRTKTIGELLQTEREKRNISVPSFAAHTKIRPEYITALEQNRFEDLPAATFVKGYIRTYAKILGFDAQPLIALLRRDFKESAVGTLVPRDFLKPVLKKRQMWTPITLTMFVLGITFLTLVSYVGFQWYSFQKPPRLSVTDPADSAFVSSQITIKGQTDTDVLLSINAQPVAIQANGSFETEIYLPREGIHTLTIEASDRRGKKSVIQRSVHVRF